MYTQREYDIMFVEAQFENDKLIQEVALELLGNRAKRMVQNAERNRGRGSSAQEENPYGNAPAGAGGNPAGDVYAPAGEPAPPI